jgi:RND family efflux transporter MFP subunit
MKTLYETGSAAAREELEDAQALAENAVQTHAAAQAAYEMAVKGPRAEQIAQAKARLAMAAQEVRRLEDQYRKFTIRAPFEGYVVSKLTEVGAWLSRGDPVAEIIALDPIEIDVAVPEAYIAHVMLGASVQVTIPAVADQTFTGSVARIVPQADLRSRSFPVKIRLKNPKSAAGHVLKSGMLARVTMAVGPRQQAMLVPKDALILGGPSPGIMVVQREAGASNPVARLVPVQLGVAEESMIQVIGELRGDDQVIVVGNERIRPGQPISVQSGDPSQEQTRPQSR